MHFLSYFYPQNGHNSVENYLIRKKFTKFKTYFEDYLEGFLKIPAQPKVSFIVSPGMNFELFLLKKKTSHNWAFKLGIIKIEGTTALVGP